MKARLTAIILAWLVAVFAALPGAAQQFSLPGAGASRPLAAAEAFALQAVPEGQGTRLVWTIAPGYYLYRDSLSATAADGSALKVETPPGTPKNDPNFGNVEIYHDSITATLPVASGDIRVTYQGCAERGICYPPVTTTLHLAANTAVAGSAGPQAPASDAAASFAAAAAAAGAIPPATAPKMELSHQAGLNGLEGRGVPLILLAYLGFGVLLAFTPCVFPMLPILLGMLARQGETLTRGRGAALSGAYVLALAAAFGLMGAVAGWSGQNLQMALQSPWAIGALSALFVLLALSGFGLFDLSLPEAITARAARLHGERGSLLGAAAMGFGSALIVGPCVSAPLAGALLYIAQSGNVALGAAALFALGLGQGIPLFVAGMFGAAVLPRAGAWMNWVRPVFAFVFLAMAVWLLSRVVPGPVTLALWAALLLGLGGALLGAPGTALRRALATIALVAGTMQAVGAASGASDPLRPLARFAATPGTVTAEATAVPAFAPVATESGLGHALAATPSRPALIYVTADWCLTCREIDSTVLHDPRVQTALAGFNRIAVDVTAPSEKTKELMQRLGAAGPPTMIFLDPDGKEPAGSRKVGPLSVQALLSSARTVEAPRS